ncbi:MAG: FxLD family lanthipeptide [Pseudonocardiaceae bacterium]
MTQITTSLLEAEGRTLDDFDLDIEFIEAGGTVEHIITMTEDNCCRSCQSAVAVADRPRLGRCPSTLPGGPASRTRPARRASMPACRLPKHHHARGSRIPCWQHRHRARRARRPPAHDRVGRSPPPQRIANDRRTTDSDQEAAPDAHRAAGTGVAT